MAVIISIDFEFNQTSEPNVNLVCCAVINVRTKEKLSWWLHNNKFNQGRLKEYLLLFQSSAIFIAHNVVAEASCFIALGLEPEQFKWYDTFLEFRMLTNHNHQYQYGEHYCKGKVVNLKVPTPYVKKMKKEKGTSGILTHSYSQLVYKFTANKIDTDHKEEMRKIIISNPDYFTTDQKESILKYCLSDVEYLYAALNNIVKIYRRLMPTDNIEEEMLWRGETNARVAKIENLGSREWFMQCTEKQFKDFSAISENWAQFVSMKLMKVPKNEIVKVMKNEKLVNAFESALKKVGVTW